LCWTWPPVDGVMAGVRFGFRLSVRPPSSAWPHSSELLVNGQWSLDIGPFLPLRHFAITVEAFWRNFESWQELPRRVQDQVWILLLHNLHSIRDVLWLIVEETSRVSALLAIRWRKRSTSISVQESAGLLRADSPLSGAAACTFDRTKTAIGELGYEVAMEDLSFPEMMGGEDTLLASDDVTVVPGHTMPTRRGRSCWG
jgi:hypothetical protein